MESTFSMYIWGVEDRVVDLTGSGRFSPQSPLPRADSVVSIAACMGCGSVEVSEFVVAFALISEFIGRGKGGGNEKSREVLSRFAVGDSLRIVIPAMRLRWWQTVVNQSDIRSH